MPKIKKGSVYFRVIVASLMLLYFWTIVLLDHSLDAMKLIRAYVNYTAFMMIWLKQEASQTPDGDCCSPRTLFQDAQKSGYVSATMMALIAILTVFVRGVRIKDPGFTILVNGITLFVVLHCSLHPRRRRSVLCRIGHGAEGVWWRLG